MSGNGNKRGLEGQNAFKEFCSPTPKSMGSSSALALAPRRGYVELSRHAALVYGPNCHSHYLERPHSTQPKQLLVARPSPNPKQVDEAYGYCCRSLTRHLICQAFPTSATCVSAQVMSSSRVGMSVSAVGVSAYSTRGGTVG